MDQFGTVDVAEQRLDVLGRVASDPPCLRTGIIYQAPCDFASFSGATQHCRAPLEIAINRRYTDSQQTAPVQQRQYSSLIECQSPGKLQMVGKPLLARCERRVNGIQKGTDIGTVCGSYKGVSYTTVRNHSVSAASRRTLGRSNFCDHAPFADSAAGTAGHGFETSIISAPFRD